MTNWTEWLTTGQMIEKLKVGQVAESHSQGYIRVIKNEDGSITHDDVGGNLVIGSGVADLDWRIVPKYVSFVNAMKAVEEGKTAVLHGHYGAKTYFNQDGLGFKAEYLFGDLLNGKWTIHEEY